MNLMNTLTFQTGVFSRDKLHILHALGDYIRP